MSSNDNTQKYVYTIEDLPETVIVQEEDIRTKFLISKNAMVSFINVPKGSTFPIHSHDAEQIMIVLEGEEHHEIDGKKIIMHAGDVCVHPANVPHGGYTPTGIKAIDIFAPARDSHVELMKEQGTYPDEFGNYKTNNK
ncbi:MAG: hypothetical protein CVU95_06655 [Firmicutes bacterium HGW-Firmicutes-2]|jgi:quercetin dioxygenase-like cupin family protein|nr:MAG: hypothetical protein CVU95_06655 [Firmicutes bacterium HGW-Firmicutes-2]